MPLIELQQNIFIPFTILLIFTGVYILVISKSAPIWNYLLSLKILSGALDQKKTLNQLAPFTALSLGRLFENTISAIFASYLAYQIYGPGILGWLFVSIPIVMPLDFAIGTLSHKLGKSITIPGRGIYRITNPTTLINKVFGSHFIGGIYAGLLIIVSVLHGVILPMFSLHLILDATGLYYPIASAIMFIIFLWIFSSGNLSRIGSISRLISIAGLFLFLITLTIIAYYVKIEPSVAPKASFLHSVMAGFVPKSLSGWLQMLSAVGIFWTLVGAGASKSGTFSGTIRTSHSAKAGLASMATTPLSVILVAPLAIFIIDSKLSIATILGTSGYFQWLVFVTFILLSITGISGWTYTGRQTMIHFFQKFRYGVFQFIMSISFILLVIYLGADPISTYVLLLNGLVLLSALPTFMILLALLMFSHIAVSEWKRYHKTKESRFEITKDSILLLFHLVPKNLISRVFGWLSYIHLPSFLRVPVITAFAKAYSIDTNESEGSIKDYPSLNKFFTRALREGVRLVAKEKNVLISPVDAHLSQFGKIQNGNMIQAKGLSYTVDDLLDGSEYKDKFNSGNFCVMYLSPQDYHRIHNPYEGDIIGFSYHPGQLFPVNSIMVNGLAGLFPKNERLTTFVKTKHGLVAVIKVGATNVGRISVTYDSIRANKWFRKERHIQYPKPIPVTRGQELGRFEMGSTVILLIENKEFKFLDSFNKGSRVRFGQILGKAK